jgi:hypothetical protein
MRPALDPEWATWSEAWRAAPGPEPQACAALAARVRREGRRLLLLAVLEGIAAVGLVAIAAVVAARDPSAPTLAWAAAVWGFTAVAWGFSLRSQRGLWRAQAAGARGFLELSRRRLRHRLAAARFGGRLLAAEIAFVAAWSLWRHSLEPDRFLEDLWRYLVVYALTALFGAGVVAWILRTRSQVRRELAGLEEIERSLDAEV